MPVSKKASAAGARRVTASLDNLASLFQHHAAALGVPDKVAKDFAYRCDLLSDSIERTAGIKQATFDPNQIGKEVSGPLEQQPPNQSWMAGEFTQQENTELHDKQVGGDLASAAAAHRADPKLASQIAQEAASIVLATLAGQVKQAADGKPFPGAAKPFGKKDDDKDEDSKKEAKKSEDDDSDEDSDDSAEKTASQFGLFSEK